MTEEYIKRYTDAGHAIQSGVSMDMNTGGTAHEPKHLRTGLELRAVDHAGLVKLLIEKGIFSEEEYLKAICESAETEKARYEKRINDKLGGNSKITLG